MSDDLIEAMARAIHDASHSSDATFLLEFDWVMDMRIAQARAALAVIRAHLEPTSEMVEAALAKGKAANLEPPLLELMRKGLLANWRDMLAASPIGEVR